VAKIKLPKTSREQLIKECKAYLTLLYRDDKDRAIEVLLGYFTNWDLQVIHDELDNERAKDD
jgi:hypothetical protein